MTYPHGNDNRNGNNQQRGGAYPDPRDARPEDELDAGEMLPEGDYPVTAKAHKIGWSGNKNPQVGVRLLIVDGPAKGKTLLWYGTFTPNSEEFTIKALRALGMTGDDVERDIRQIYGGQQAIAVVAHEQYKGKTRAKVQWINGADVQMKDEMDGNDLRAFAQRMRGTFARYGGGGSAPAPGPSRQTQQPSQGRGEPPRDDRRPPPQDDMPWNDPPPDRRR